MIDMRQTLTEEQARQKSQDLKVQMDQALEQLEQEKGALIQDLRAAHVARLIEFSECERLIEQAAAIRLEMVYVSGIVTVVRSYEDDLHDFLSRSDIPESLQRFMRGGILIGTPEPTIPS